MIVILIITILVAKYLREEISSLQVFRKKLKYYPLALLIIWFFPSIDKILTVEGYRNSAAEQTFSYLTAIAFAGQGLANFLLYSFGYIRKVFQRRHNANQTNTSNLNIYSLDNEYHPDQYTKFLVREFDEKSNNDGSDNDLQD